MPLKGTGITSWLDRQAEAAEESIGGKVERFLQHPSRQAASSSDIARPTQAVWLRMIGATGARKLPNNKWEAMIDGSWTLVDDPATYFRKKSKEKWGDTMPEDKGKDKGKKPEQKNKKGGPMFAEDDFPIQGMNPTSGPLGGGPPAEVPPTPGPESAVQGGQEALSGAKWAEPILAAIPGNRSDLMSKALKLIGQLGEIMVEAGYTEGGAPPGVEGGQPPVVPGSKPSPQSSINPLDNVPASSMGVRG